MPYELLTHIDDVLTVVNKARDIALKSSCPKCKRLKMTSEDGLLKVVTECVVRHRRKPSSISVSCISDVDILIDISVSVNAFKDGLYMFDQSDDHDAGEIHVIASASDLRSSIEGAMGVLTHELCHVVQRLELRHDISRSHDDFCAHSSDKHEIDARIEEILFMARTNDMSVENFKDNVKKHIEDYTHRNNVTCERVKRELVCSHVERFIERSRCIRGANVQRVQRRK
jgi:hypothetical protein